MGSKNKDKKGHKRQDGSTSMAKVGNKKVITDPRFASSQMDPRFQRLPKRKSKVEIDSRFSRMFTDKNFSTSSAPVDKHGKAKRNDPSQHPLKHYYHFNEEDEKQDQAEKMGKLNNVDNVESDEENEDSMDERGTDGEKLNINGDLESDKESEENGEEGEEEEFWRDESDSTGSTSGSDDEDDVYSEEEEGNFLLEEDVPKIDKETHRLAVVNMDWSHVKAVDLYVLLSSFLPKGGQISSVTVYPSEFGLKRMEEEEKHGPVALFGDEKSRKASDDEEDENKEIDNEKLRAYELSKLSYYYAVVECDSVATADYLYQNCDGFTLEESANKLDLRFIPDSMEFNHAPRDVAKEAPANYAGNKFQTKALQHSKVDLTWEDDEPERSKKLKRKFNADEFKEFEGDEDDDDDEEDDNKAKALDSWKEFLASDDSDTDEDENGDASGDGSGKRRKNKDKYRALLQSGDGSDEEEDDGQDMEVTFNTGLEDISKKILEKKDKQAESVWEAYLRKKKEKKNARKRRSKDSSEDEDEDDNSNRERMDEPDDFFVEEPAPKRKKGNQSKSALKREQNLESANEAEASKAELELLLAGDEGEDAKLKGYNLKRKKFKGKKGREALDEDKIPTVDYDDSRFSALFNSPLFALDPTDPQFKRSAAYARQIAQKKKKGEPEESRELARQAQVPSNEPVQTEPSAPSKEKRNIDMLVKSIKMKSKQVALASNGKNFMRKGK